MKTKYRIPLLFAWSALALVPTGAAQGAENTAKTAPSLPGNTTGRGQYGTLRVSTIDQSSKLPTPVRVELLDAKNEAHIAEDALAIGTNYEDRKTPWQGTLDQEKARLSKTVNNSNTGTKQFYSAGTFTASVPAGTYRLTRIFHT